MPTGNEPSTAPPPAYNPDPAITGATTPTVGPGPDEMLVIAAYKKGGAGAWPGMDWFAQKIGALLEGEAGLWLVYSTTQPAPPPATPPYVVRAAGPLVHYYHLPTDATYYSAVKVTWPMTVLERTGPPLDFVKVLASPEIWVPAGEVVPA